jgi:hypothetical protein
MASGESSEPKGGSIFAEILRRILFVMELIVEVRDAEEGGYCARGLGYAVFTEGETWDELRANVLEAVSLHFEDAEIRPRLVQVGPSR